MTRLIVAGTHSGVGKTTVATALMAALTRRGLRVQGFKIGPDFIDPGFHAVATGRPGRNLDGWMLSRGVNQDLFTRHTADADAAVIEGVMGLFDGQVSTAEMARWLDTPVVLVVDASAMAASAAAVVKGFEKFEPGLEFAGVLFNRVAGEGHFRYLRQAVEAHCAMPVLGWLPPEPAIELPERHLGLHLAAEVLTEQRLCALAGWFERGIDLEGFFPQRSAAIAGPESAPATAGPRIAVARDRAFCFYYQDNLDLLRSLGAQLVEFSPIADAHLPAGAQGLYLGGGYPELHAAALSANRSLREEIAAFSRAGRPVIAECGGFMYLTEAIVGLDGTAFPMVGLYATRARMQEKLAAIGYAEIEPRPGQRVRGHEFRYSTVDPPVEPWQGRTMASYVHLHWLSCPAFAERFVADCEAAA